MKECSALRAKLPSNSPANNFLLSTFRSSFWIETAVDVISEDKKLLRNGNSSAFEMKEKCEYISRAAEVLYRNCDKTLTTVCQRTEDLTWNDLNVGWALRHRKYHATMPDLSLGNKPKVVAKGNDKKFYQFFFKKKYLIFINYWPNYFVKCQSFSKFRVK